MAQAKLRSVIGVFKDRESTENAIDGLQGKGFERGSLSLLRGRPEDFAASGQSRTEATFHDPIDSSDVGNVQGLMTGIPTYLAAVLAAGVTVASGGTLAGVAVAAVAAGAGAAALSGGAAGIFKAGFDKVYEDQLKQGGIILLAATRHAGDEAIARSVMSDCGATAIQGYAADEVPQERGTPVA